MKTLDIATTREPLSAVVPRLNGEPIALLQSGKAVAVLIPLKDSDLESLAMSFDPKFIAMIEEARAQARAGNVIPFEEICARHGLDVPQGGSPTRRKRKDKR